MSVSNEVAARLLLGNHLLGEAAVALRHELTSQVEACCTWVNDDVPDLDSIEDEDWDGFAELVDLISAIDEFRGVASGQSWLDQVLVRSAARKVPA